MSDKQWTSSVFIFLFSSSSIKSELSVIDKVFVPKVNRESQSRVRFPLVVVMTKLPATHLLLLLLLLLLARLLLPCVAVESRWVSQVGTRSEWFQSGCSLGGSRLHPQSFVSGPSQLTGWNSAPPHPNTTTVWVCVWMDGGGAWFIRAFQSLIIDQFVC